MQGAVILFELSPAGTDNAVGLSPLNEVPAVLNSTGSGNTNGAGITFDTGTLTLNLSLGYGSALGFSDLTGAATGAAIQTRRLRTRLLPSSSVSSAPLCLRRQSGNWWLHCGLSGSIFKRKPGSPERIGLHQH